MQSRLVEELANFIPRSIESVKRSLEGWIKSLKRKRKKNKGVFIWIRRKNIARRLKRR